MWSLSPQTLRARSAEPRLIIAGWLRTRCLTSLCLRFIICKLRMTVPPFLGWLWGWDEITSVTHSQRPQRDLTRTALNLIQGHTAELPLEPCCSPTSQLSEPPSAPTPPCLCPRRTCRPHENKPMPSHGWSLASRMRQHHNPLLDSLQLQPTAEWLTELVISSLHPQPTPPSIPASQPHSSSPGTSAELGRCRPRLQVLDSAEARKPTLRGAPGTCQNTAFKCQTGATPGGWGAKAGRLRPQATRQILCL